MTNVCQICEKPLKEGDKVSVMVSSTYHALKSQVAYALDKADMVADSSTLVHTECHLLEDSGQIN